MLSLRERILGKEDAKTSVVDVPEWGESIRVRSLTAHEQERWWDILDQQAKGNEPAGGRKASFVMMACLDETGADLFKPEDVAVLGKKHPEAIHRLFAEIQKLSGMASEVQAEIEKKPDDTTNSSSIG